MREFFMSDAHYVLITAARNEEAYIEKTIQAVVAQTRLPGKWVIVSDGSTDRTDEIIERYAAHYAFIELLRITGQGKRDFASKVNAINAGFERLAGLDYAFIGILDADITFEPNYYQDILARFEQDPKLGIAGGEVRDLYNGRAHKVPMGEHSVRGAVQLFRRACYEDIGGLVPLRTGGEDTVAETLARMHGWKVRTFPEFQGLHLKPTGRQYGPSMLLVRFRQGLQEYQLGYHPLFAVVKSVSRLSERPWFVGGLCRLAGYCYGMIRREKRSLSDDVVSFVRNEQVQRLKLIKKLSYKSG
jgi:GT2 family glycosyltransferase